ncbi:EF-hand domain protein [Caulobacter vibrioides]|nr:EF-hand domain protein [Caulobacter vibrioides]YP_002516611.2 EF-hand domain protein [Caulobacter vibrioides NA1000]ACL94703.2 EF-hand domain protein [Caulobacter vibrioides NA1000]QXZ53262.1 hypothetical protein KZH45_06195 [Caulobacter vibrioides]
MTLRLLGLTAALATVLAACASAPPGGPGGRPGPPDDDGPRREAGGQQLFISPAGEPFRAPPNAPYPVEIWFGGADANHDGALTRDEFVADALRFFATLDTDRSGVIDAFEVSAYENRVAPEILGGPAPSSLRRGPMGLGQDGGGEAPRRRPQGANVLQGAAFYGLIAEPQPVMASDGDFDRRITRDEATKAAKTRFALLDTDKDGQLRLAELPRTPAQKGLRQSRDGKGPGRMGGPGGGPRG